MPKLAPLLIVEDHRINQQVALLILKDMGFEADIADNGQDALEKLTHKEYSLIFMDVQMPVMNGFEATLAIRKEEAKSGNHIPIIAMTAHVTEGSKEECLAAGMDDYVSKPVYPELLQEVLAKWMPR